MGNSLTQKQQEFS